MKQNKLPLPIDSYLEEITQSLDQCSTLILKASPGSGKTTRLPWAVAQSLKTKVLVLEPRRLAAKLAALRISDEEGFNPGQEVGYQFRFEKLMSSESKLIFYTEGTFLRKFLSDPLLSDIGAVILDEFHERHLETDQALALLRNLQKKRPLKLILMSATLDTRLSGLFSDAKTIEIEAPAYKVELHYLPNRPSVLNESLEKKVKAVIDKTHGDTLVFLPGMREMLRVQSVLQDRYRVFLLHADLSKEEQQLALQHSEERKIILSTNIAESSVTIPGITTVIDSGIQREAHYSAWNGLKFIKDAPVTQSSAIQRAGRAGRTGPGECYRLFSEQDFLQRSKHTEPEIFRANLTDTFLLLAHAQIEPLWFEPPPEEKWQKAKELLFMMGAIDEKGVTPVGKKMLTYPLEARLARILVSGKDLALTEKRKLLTYLCEEIEEDRSGVLKKRLSFFLEQYGDDKGPWERHILSGFIDQVARFRPKYKDFIHRSGKTLKPHPSLEILSEGLYIIFDITQRQEAFKVLEIEEEWLWELEPFPLHEEEEIQIEESVIIRKKTRLGSIVLDETLSRPIWSDLSGEQKNKTLKLSAHKFSQKIKGFQESVYFQKVSFWARHKGVGIEEVLENLSPQEYFESQRLLQFEGVDSYIVSTLELKLDLSELPRQLPDKIYLGGKRELKIHYPQGMDPFIEAPIQEFYGLSETPSLLSGQVPLTLRLLGPHKRPIQITKDLAGFWQKTYQEMKKEYQREYPKHYWPEKPWEAKPYLLKSHLPKA